MKKRIITLIVTSSLLSVGILFLGISLLKQYTPASASPLGALVAGINSQFAQDNTSLSENAPATTDTLNENEKLQGSSMASTAPSVKISQILSDPTQFYNQIYTISGIATLLGDDKLLLNDGTGQILVEVDDDLLGFLDINSQTVSITGKFDDSNSFSGIEMDVCELTDQNGTVIVDDCSEDDIDDDDDSNDLDDDDDDDSDDDLDDDDDDLDDDDDDDDED